MNVIRIFAFLIFLSSSSLVAQETEKPLFILFENEGGVIESGKKSYYEPEKRYPLDVGRAYIMSTFRFCDTCSPRSWLKTEFIFTFYPNNSESKFRSIEIADFYRTGRVLNQKWFDETTFDEIYTTLKGAEDVYLVDTGYLRDGKYVLLKVDYYSGEY